MGYTTEFQGHITVEPVLTLEQFNTINALTESEEWRSNASIPNGWCGWRAKKDGKGIEWDDSEKFYYSVEWMQYIINMFPDLNFSGEINAQGEDMNDRWVLVVDNNVAAKRDVMIVGQRVTRPKCDCDFVLEDNDED